MSDDQNEFRTDEPSGLTGFWICDHGPDSSMSKRGHRYEVKFSFEGEIFFDDMADARASAAEYQEIIRSDDPEKARMRKALRKVKAIMESMPYKAPEVRDEWTRMAIAQAETGLGGVK